MVIVLVVLVVPGVFLQVMQVVQVGQGVLVVQEGLVVQGVLVVLLIVLVVLVVIVIVVRCQLKLVHIPTFQLELSLSTLL